MTGLAEKLKIIFMGTPEFSAGALDALIKTHDVIAVYSQPPRPKGRGQQVQKSPVHELAEQNNIPVFTPLSFKKDADAVVQFKNLNADVAVVAAYGLILPQAVLDAPKYGCLNIHASLLPRWRGASPIQHAIWKGDTVSGVTIMRMELGLDTGPMLLKRETPITDQTTTQSLHDALSTMGAEMIVDVLSRFASPVKTGTFKTPASSGEALVEEKQDDAESVYAPMLRKEDGAIDWNDAAIDIDRQVRALNPWPGTYTVSKGKRLKILGGQVASGGVRAVPGTVLEKGVIACGAGFYQLLTVQPENSKAMDASSAVNGKYLNAGDVLQ